MAVKDHQAREIQGVEYGTARVRLDFGDFDEEDTSQQFTWAELAAAHPTGSSSVPANAHIIEAGVIRLVDFAGGAVSAVVLDLGDAGNDDELLADVGLFTGAKATGAVASKNGAYTLWTREAAYSPLITVTTTDGNVDDLTAGACEIYIVYAAISTDPRVLD